MQKDLILNINHSVEDFSFEEALSAYSDTKSGYVCSFPNFSLKYNNFKKFISDVNAELCVLTEYDFSDSKNNFLIRYTSEFYKLYAVGNSIEIFVTPYAVSEEYAEKLWKIYKRYKTEDTQADIFVKTFYMDNGKLVERIKNIKYEDFEYISELYYPYINTDVMFDQFFTGNENILLLVGEPGLGKSKMASLAIKHAYSNTDKLPYDKRIDNPSLENQYLSIVYVKSVDVLSEDKFWRNLESSQDDLVIIDDLDYMLTKRDSEVSSHEDIKKNLFLNQFLSFTDGVEKYRTKFIITTNQSYENIDTALLRKGRLFDILELRHLDKKEALRIWESHNLNKEYFNKIFTSHEILPSILGSEISKQLNKRIDNSLATYLLEDGISKVIKAVSRKKIAL